MTEGPDIAAIRARLEAATPGPWKATASGVSTPIGELDFLPGIAEADQPGWSVADMDAAADFIAHAPSDIAALLQALEVAEQDNESLRTALTREGDALKLVLVEKAAAERRVAEVALADAILQAVNGMSWAEFKTRFAALTKQEEPGC